jgi:hypothetical protein
MIKAPIDFGFHNIAKTCHLFSGAALLTRDTPMMVCIAKLNLAPPFYEIIEQVIN